MSSSFLGYPDQKTKEEIEYRNMETIEGKWIVYDSDMTVLNILSIYTDNTSEGRVWTDDQTTRNNRVIFGPGRGIRFPVWQYYQTGQIELKNNYPMDSKIKYLETTDDKILKWTKTPKYKFLVTSNNIDNPGFCSTLTVKVNSNPVSMTYKEQKEIQEGSTVEYTITMTSQSFEISKINGISVGPEEKRTCTRTFTMNEDTTITVTFL